MNTDVLSQVPDANDTGTITADELTLVGVDDDIIDRRLVGIVPLQSASASIPHLDGSILGAGHHPFALAMERNTGDIVSVAIKGHHRVGIGRLDVVELHIGMAGRCEVALVRSNTEAVHLGIGMLDRAGTDSRQGFPEATTSADHMLRAP